jgi:glycerol-3-phosphate O-acyltransferase
MSPVLLEPETLTSRVDALVADPRFPQGLRPLVVAFFGAYRDALRTAGVPPEPHDHLLETLVTLMFEQLDEPFVFEPFHAQITAPFDHYRYGLDFLRPLVVKERSTLRGREHLDRAVAQLAGGDNVILLANHQIEGDPQAISLMLEDDYAGLGQAMIFVAGDRVTTDPLAVPFSMGRNLLCIYSKRHIEHPPEQRKAKTLHNKRTMERMSELLSEGGKCIYVAPSGGRDRVGASGKAEVARFDPQSVDMMWLMAERSGRPTHFYPMALFTFDLVPPPATISVELGESRHFRRSAIDVGLGAEIDMEAVGGDKAEDRHERRERRAEAIWRMVANEYAAFGR